MKHISCTVAATAAAFGARRLVTLTAPDLPRMRPGQLVLARVNETLDPYLPCAYFPLPADQPGKLTLLVEADDPLGGPDVPGKQLELIAPVGNGFALDTATRRLLLVADAAGLAPLIALAHEASQKQIAVSLLVHGREKADGASLAAWLSEMLPLDVEYQVSAELDAVLPALLGWADQVCAAGDGALYARLKGSPGLEGRMRRVGGRTHAFHPAARNTGPFGHTGKAAFGNPKGPSIAPAVAQVVVAPLMACGTGACQGCAVEIEQGMRLACVEGPVFDLAELL